jgi:chromosome segregation ATPase
MLQTQEQRTVELCTLNNTLSSKVDRQTEELKSSCSEIEMLQKLVQENQHKMAQAREKNRRSVVVVESKLESIVADSQSQLATLQSQLAEEVRLRSELQERLCEFENSVALKEAEVESFVFRAIMVQKYCEDFMYSVQMLQYMHDILCTVSKCYSTCMTHS